VVALSGDANMAAATPQRYIMGSRSYGQLHDKGTSDISDARLHRLHKEITLENISVGWEKKVLWELSRLTGILTSRDPIVSE
jgi:hypothetical protein